LDREFTAVPRKVRGSNLETRTARSRLPVRHKPYFRLIEPGLHLGYRKLTSGPGTWIARRYGGKGRYAVENLRTPDSALVLADDFEEADGVRVMSFAEAQRAVRGPRAHATGGLTVGDIVADYLSHIAADGRSRNAANDTRTRAAAHILPTLGPLKISALTTDRLRRWRDDLASSAPRNRTRNGEKQNHRPMPDDDDGRRARRASANRLWTILRAALNHGFSGGKIDSDISWRKVKPFKQVDSARVRYLSIAEARRLVNACDGDFRPLVQAALQTGARYGELARLQVQDFNRDAGTLAIRQSKTGKPRHVVLTGEGQVLFESLTAGLPGHELMLRRASGKPWDKSNQQAPMAEACRIAKIVPPISFHGLRHSWASLSIMNGVPLIVVAKNLGHRDTRMCELHYGHLAPSHVADEIRKGAPKFGFKPSREVVALG
jgi:integrase